MSAEEDKTALATNRLLVRVPRPVGDEIARFEVLKIKRGNFFVCKAQRQPPHARAWGLSSPRFYQRGRAGGASESQREGV